MKPWSGESKTEYPSGLMELGMMAGCCGSGDWGILESLS